MGPVILITCNPQTLNADLVRVHLSVTAGRMKNIHRWIPNTRVTYMEEKTEEGLKK